MSLSYEDVQEIIRREVAKQVTALLIGKAKNAEKGREDVEEIYPNAPTIEKRRVMHPYGLKSRAKDGTTAVVGVQGAHAANRIVLGHRDDDGPEPDAIGAVVLYDAFGNSVHLKDGKIVVTLDDKLELGAGATKAAARKGDEVKTYIPIGAVIVKVVSGVGSSNVDAIECTGSITGDCSGKVTITD